MKTAQIGIFANEQDPTEKVVMVKGIKPGSGTSKIFKTARAGAAAYALYSTMNWWRRTVNAPWRSAPNRYDKYRSYNDRVTRRIYGLMRAKGVR